MLSKIKNIRLKGAGTFIITAIVIIAAYKLIMNVETFIGAVYSGIKYVSGLLMPFLMGAILAYLLNPAVKFFEKRVYGKIKKLCKSARVLSIITVYAISAAVVFFILNMLIPLLVKSIADIIQQIPEYIAKLQSLRNGEWNHSVVGRVIFNAFSAIEREISAFLSQSDLSAFNPAVTGILGRVINVTGTVFDVIFGIIISVYFILEKDNLLAGVKKINRALFDNKTSDKISNHTAQAHQIFSSFIVGKTIDSLIIGVICIFGLMILRVNNSALFGVIVGVTNMIPYFGPFIGGIPVVLLVLFESPLKALWTGLFIFALQQVDGMLLGPKILGNSINLSPFWIIFAILIGGGLFGVMGMFLGAPTLAVILLEVNRLIDRRIRKKETSGKVQEE